MVKATKQENAILRDSKRDVHWARDELGTKRNHCIWAKNDLKMAVEDATRKAVADTIEQVRLEAEEEKEREAGRDGRGP